MKALVADPALPVSSVLRRHLEGMGFEVKVVHYLDEAVERIRAGELDLILTAATAQFDGETLCRKAKQLLPRCPVVLIYPPEEEDPEPHAAGAGADGWMVGPLKRTLVVGTVRSVLRLRELAERVERLEAELGAQVAAASVPPATPSATPGLSGAGGGAATGFVPGLSGADDATGAAQNTADFGFFKKFLLTEVKRSRRYRYPVALLLVALDGFAGRTAGFGAQERTAVLAEALGTVSRCIRDIDLAVPFGDERFLVFLPHTGRDGALTVAGRLRDNLGALQSLTGGTASVGVATYEPGTGTASAAAGEVAQAGGAASGGAGGQVSFGSLMKEASEALRRAQASGGNAVDAGERKVRDRISLG